VTPYSHVMEFSGGSSVVEIGYADVDEFARPLRHFDGAERFALTMWPLPEGMDYDQARAAGRDALEYVQTAGSADALTVEIRKPGGSQWAADWVRYVVGHPHSGDAPLEVAIPLPHATEMIARHEVFTPDEAAELFYRYFKTGDIPADYPLRPVEAYTRDGRNIDLHDEASRSR
jgi:hypothetical protein